MLFAAENYGTVVLPLIVSASRFSRVPEIARYQSINDPSRPLDGLRTSEQELVLDDMARRIEFLTSARPTRVESNEVGESYIYPGLAPSVDLVSIDVAAALISEQAKRAGVKVGRTVNAPVSIFGTSSCRAIVSDGKGVIYCHANGPNRAATFYVRKGIGWFYERVLLGAASPLGLPITGELVEDGLGYATSRFEGGYIEWSPNTRVARAVLRSPRSDQTLAERMLG